ncbi:cobW-domain-containing protein [Gautieria morchelliformis]|nr:cobW-domain-containing protein [Gautieria morchelliformis]
MTSRCVPVTVFTGFLGAGKTSIILSLLPQLPVDYKVVLLKNEFGDVEVDSQLAMQSSLTAVSEILNGCMCCVLVGQMKTALLEIKEKYYPDRIIIETSGSAFPATLAFQIRQLEEETNGGFKLDAIVTVIDAENFTGYEDKSLTAKMQAQYTDLILLNKWENAGSLLFPVPAFMTLLFQVTDRQLDLVIDHLNDLNDETPRLRCSGRNGVPPSLIFGLDSKLYLEKPATANQPEHHDEVETIAVSRGAALHRRSLRNDGHMHSHGSPSEESTMLPSTVALNRETLVSALEALPKESVWRVKGFVRFAYESRVWILNWAFGRYEFTIFTDTSEESGKGQLQLTVMGASGELRTPTNRFASKVGGELS